MLPGYGASFLLRDTVRKTKNISPLGEIREVCLIHLSIIHVTSGKYPWVRNVSRLLPGVSRGAIKKKQGGL
jgi:hypothetical protein